MAKNKTVEPEVCLESADAAVPRPRLSKLVIRNFRCITDTPVEIDLDDIVVLVGPNNVGKSTILRAYEVVMNHGSAAGKLTEADFPGHNLTTPDKPEIELLTVVYDNTPGEQWIHPATATDSLSRRDLEHVLASVARRSVVRLGCPRCRLMPA